MQATQNAAHKLQIPIRRTYGFTLVELLAVIAIIGILAAIVLNLSGLAGKKSDTGKTAAAMETIKNGLEEYRLEHGTYYPYSVTQPFQVPAFSNELKKFVPTVRFNDAWGNVIQYVFQSQFQYRLFSMGVDGITNTPDDVESAKGSY